MIISTKILNVTFRCKNLFKKSEDYDKFLKRFIAEQNKINLFDENEDKIKIEIAKILIKHLTLREKDQQSIKKGALEKATEYIINDFTNIDDHENLKEATEIKKKMTSWIPEFLTEVKCLTELKTPDCTKYEMNFEEMENFLKDNSEDTR